MNIPAAAAAATQQVQFDFSNLSEIKSISTLHSKLNVELTFQKIVHAIAAAVAAMGWL